MTTITGGGLSDMVHTVPRRSVHYTQRLALSICRRCWCWHDLGVRRTARHRHVLARLCRGPPAANLEGPTVPFFEEFAHVRLHAASRRRLPGPCRGDRLRWWDGTGRAGGHRYIIRERRRRAGEDGAAPRRLHAAEHPGGGGAAG